MLLLSSLFAREPKIRVNLLASGRREVCKTNLLNLESASQSRYASDVHPGQAAIRRDVYKILRRSIGRQTFRILRVRQSGFELAKASRKDAADQDQFRLCPMPS